VEDKRDKKLALITHEDCLKHDPGHGHPERPARLEAVLDSLQKDSELASLTEVLSAREATEDELALAHERRHVRWVRDRCAGGPSVLDGDDTFAVAESFRAAALAAGAVLDGVDGVAGGSVANVFCAVRPPGHHAESAASMGFCLFNNVAVGARYAQGRGLERVAVVDFDVHHGNGTERIFYEDGGVLYISLHQYPHYPGTGAATDIGRGQGKGANVNVPLRSGTGDEEYLSAVRTKVAPALSAFKPDLLIMSAGFDAHAADPLSEVMLTDGAYHEFTRLILDACRPSALGRAISVLEGGYNLESLAASARAHVRALAGLDL
jgi:acetoin utilization deacetylase AcuC-like enzyme